MTFLKQASAAAAASCCCCLRLPALLASPFVASVCCLHLLLILWSVNTAPVGVSPMCLLLTACTRWTALPRPKPWAWQERAHPQPPAASDDLHAQALACRTGTCRTLHPLTQPCTACCLWQLVTLPSCTLCCLMLAGGTSSRSVLLRHAAAPGSCVQLYGLALWRWAAVPKALLGVLWLLDDCLLQRLLR